MTDNLPVEVSLPDDYEAKLVAVKKLYPQSRSAIMPALYLAQQHFGHISDEAVRWVAARLELPPVHVMEVASFYTMYYKRPVGRYHVQVCRTLSCAVRGASAITECVKKRFGVGANEVTPSGDWSYEEVECLGSCGTAPMVQINDFYFENLDVEKLEGVLDRIEKERPNLRISSVSDAMPEGLIGCPKSEVI
jgi:NADH-quinone oxidoreductase E subunit